MGSEVQGRMPEKVQQVEFTEVQRTPTGLTRVVKAGPACSIFLEKGCVVVREMVEEGGRKVVKSVALPLNSGLVRAVHLEDEVVEETRRCGTCCAEYPSSPSSNKPECVQCFIKRYPTTMPEDQGTVPAVHPGGLATGTADPITGLGSSTADQLPAQGDDHRLATPAEEGHVIAQGSGSPELAQRLAEPTPATTEEAVPSRRPRRR